MSNFNCIYCVVEWVDEKDIFSIWSTEQAAIDEVRRIGTLTEGHDFGMTDKEILKLGLGGFMVRKYWIEIQSEDVVLKIVW